MPVWLSAGEARCLVAIGSPRAAKPGALSSNLELQIHILYVCSLLDDLVSSTVNLAKKAQFWKVFARVCRQKNEPAKPALW